MAELIEHQAQIAGAERHVGLDLGHALPLIVAQADLLRDEARGARHHLHQARGAGGGARVGDEAALLAHEAEDPRLVEIVGLRVLGEDLPVRQRIAQREVMRAHRAVGRLDRAVPDLGAARELRRGQELRVVEVADAEEPFAHALGAHA